MSLERMNLDNASEPCKKTSMTFEELLQRETFGAFNEFIKVTDAKTQGLLPESYHNIFNDKCKCGSDMIIKSNLTTFQCCNPRCYIKLGYMLNETFSRFGVNDAFSKMGIKGFGPATCISAMEQAVKFLDIPSHIELFSLGRFELPTVISNYRLDDFEYAKQIMLSKQYTLADLVSKLGLPGLGDKAHDIFEDYNSVAELDEDIDAVGDIPRLLSTKGIYASMMAYNLRTYLPDIILAQMRFNEQIRMQAGQTIDIVMTGRLSPNGVSMSKDAFLDLLNKEGTTSDGISLYGFRRTSAVKSVPYVVADYPTNYSNYKEGSARGVIISSTELLNKVKELVKGAEKNEQ